VKWREKNRIQLTVEVKKIKVILGHFPVAY
jgi:hypothetical protein